jgi:peptide/nickel transport system permease protein
VRSHELLRYTLRRLGQMVIVLALMSVLIFLLVKIIPGDPARELLGERASQESVDALHRRWGLDRPLWEQYWAYMARLVRGDLGTSLRYQVPLTEILPRRAGVTAFLVVYSTSIALLAAIPLALTAALHRDRWPDRLIRAATTVPLAAPGFWIAILVQLCFALWLRLFPASGYGDGFFGHLHHLFLPALTLSLPFACLLARNLRSSLIDVIATTHVDFARAQGLPRTTLLLRHILRPALVSAVTLVGLYLAYAIGGAIFTETVFALPGLGTLMLESISRRDYQVVQSLTLLLALGTMLLNLVADLVHAALDPRVRLGKERAAS